MNSAELLYDVGKRHLDEQVNRADALERKAIGTLTLGSAIVPISLSLMHLQNSDISSANIVGLVLCLIFYVLVALFSLLTLNVQEWVFGPAIPDLKRNAEELHPETLYLWVANEFLFSVSDNERQLSRMARLLTLSFLFLPLEILSLAIVAFFGSAK